MRVSKMIVYRLVHGGELAAVRVGRSFQVPVGRSFQVPEPAVRHYLVDARTDVAPPAARSGRQSGATRSPKSAPVMPSGWPAGHCTSSMR